MEAYRDIFAEHLIKEAVRFFPELASSPVEVVFRSVDERSTATLYRYYIIGGGEQYPVLVKQHHQQITTHEVVNQRPLRYQVDNDEKYWLESHALMRIEAYFKELNDARFGAIRVLDMLPEHQATIMMESLVPNLRSFFLNHNRVQHLFNAKDLLPIFRNAGRWLYHFHGLEIEDHVEVCYDKREDYVQGIRLFTVYLAEHVDGAAYFEVLLTTLEQYAHDILPEILPCGRAHMDYAMRNILVEADNNVIVVDTLAKWHVPIYEDIGYFAARLWTSQLQFYTQGLTFDPEWIWQCSHAFLSGYFAEEIIPLSTVRLYEVLALLDQWCAVIERLEFIKSRLIRQVRLKLTNRHFRHLINQYLVELKQLSPQHARL